MWIAISDAHAFVKVAIAERALQNMRQRQDRESLMGSICRDTRQAAPQVGHDVTVRQHHAFGCTGGAGSIDNGRQVPRIDGQRFGADTVHRWLVKCRRLGDDPRQGSVDAGRLFHGDDGLHLSQFRQERLQDVPLFCTCGDGGPAPAVPQQISDLRWR